MNAEDIRRLIRHAEPAEGDRVGPVIGVHPRAAGAGMSDRPTASYGVPGGAYIQVHRSDPRDLDDPFCGCHDDPWALCPRWREWGITEAEHKAAENRAAGGA